MEFKKVLEERILVLDGALGTMIQKLELKESDFRGREFLNHRVPLFGFNDILNLTKPSSIKKIHRNYLEAGADIITTNTFNSNAVSMADYGLDKQEELILRINKEGAQIAREAIREYEKNNNKGLHFIAGSIGPTNRSSSMSPDISDPLKRNITYDELFEAYYTQIRGLIDGGVDILLFETFFDTLNLKAALNAGENIFKETGKNLPIMVSATISDKAGRILSGQTLEALVNSIASFDNIISIGINCGFGPRQMMHYVDELYKINPRFTSCHPNAGLPDVSGCYNVTPKEFKADIKKLLEERKVNIIGGCCGTTPEYIKELSELVKEYSPASTKKIKKELRLAGLESLVLESGGFLKIGERCNVAGSKKFLRLIKERKFEEASEIAKEQIEAGADILDINMDDPLLDAEKEMVEFIRYILADPYISKVPFMIDSSKWSVIDASVKNIQGKGIVNSLSLKEGEDEFKKRSLKVKELGFALIVMAFDEKGQADTYERKIEVCKRSYDILTKECGFQPEDIIFDVNVMTIATGMPEHNNYAVDFIKATKWIKENLPYAKVSAGVSNLSFAFRGKNKIREFMHKIFLHHAEEAGLDMAIINPNQTVKYEDIPLKYRNVIEDLVLNRNNGSVEELINLANEENLDEKKQKNIVTTTESIPISEVLKEDMIKGELHHLQEHLDKAIQEIKDPLKIIEGPLLEGMKTVGELFGEGKMFLPQVVKTARSMKKAVDILNPLFDKVEKSNEKAGKILIATVKGDVHDIGKNIVSTILSCNNYEVIDLGIMVEADKILEVVLTEKPDIICLSGLITPSLHEMAYTVQVLKEAGIDTPVMVGGAATSLKHTALKIDPEYNGIVLYAGDASQNPIIARQLLNDLTRKEYIDTVKLKYKELREEKRNDEKLVSFSKVLEIVKRENRNDFLLDKPNIILGEPIVINLPLDEIKELINWKMFFNAWKLNGDYLKYIKDKVNVKGEEAYESLLNEEEKLKLEEAINLYNQGQTILQELINDNSFDGKCLIRFEKAIGNLYGFRVNEIKFPMLRQQREGTQFLSCSDYIGNTEENYIGFFAVTAGETLNKMTLEKESKGDSFTSLIISSLSDRLVEAGAEWLHRYVNENIWNAAIRPAWGYPMLPDQTMILATKEFLPYEKIGVTLTENGAMYPSSSISGLFFGKKEAKYFMVGEIGEDQLKEYAKERGMSYEKIKTLLR